MIRDYTTLCQYTYSCYSITILVTALDIHRVSSSSQNKANLHEQFQTVTKLQWTIIMMLQTATFEPLTFLSYWYMFFQYQDIRVDSESGKQARKNHTVSAENTLFVGK